MFASEYNNNILQLDIILYNEALIIIIVASDLHSDFLHDMRLFFRFFDN
jgi:hypothetical protein